MMIFFFSSKSAGENIAWALKVWSARASAYFGSVNYNDLNDTNKENDLDYKCYGKWIVLFLRSFSKLLEKKKKKKMDF